MTKSSSILFRTFLVVVALLLGQVSLSAQLLPERSLVRQGNEQFERRNFYNSFNRYSEALEHAPGSYEALYNRANAYLHLMMSNPQDSTLTREVSNKYFEVIANNKYLSAKQRAEVLRNLGESLFLQQEYESALNAFRESLKLNPDDQETKRNYVLTKRIVDQKRDAQQRQQQNQNQDQHNDQDQQNDQSQNDGGDNGQDPNSQNPNGNDQSENEGENPDQQQEPEQDEGENPEDEGDQGGQQPESEGLSDEQERMLDAIQAEENKTQDKIKEGQKGVVIHGKKNW